MLTIVYIGFVVLGFLCVVLHLRCRWDASNEIAVVNPNFVSFQKNYFRVYFPALMAEWLQGPYLYKLYSHYGFIDTQIAVIYVCGFASSVFFGTSCSYLANVCGRKKACVFFTIVYSICCLTKLSRNYGVLIIGRILGGISTSLLFSAFDAWYVYEHTQIHDFPSEWVSQTFSKATLFNSLISVVAGIVANCFAEWFGFGPVAPFLVAIPFLMAAGVLIHLTWDENYGARSHKIFHPCFESLRHIITSPRVKLIGAVTSFFESVMYIFVFLWTPVLDRANAPLGIVFASFMLCVMVGSVAFDFFLKKGVAPAKIIVVAIVAAAAANSGAAFAGLKHPRLSFIMFLLLELACGVYFPAMGWLRQRILPEAHHAGIINWFRVPLNVIAAVVLMVLHDTHSSYGIELIFGMSAVLLGVGALCAFRLLLLIRNDENLRLFEQIEEERLGVSTS